MTDTAEVRKRRKTHVQHQYKNINITNTSHEHSDQSTQSNDRLKQTAKNLQTGDSCSSVACVNSCHSIILRLQQTDLVFDKTFRNVAMKRRLGLHFQQHGKMAA